MTMGKDLPDPSPVIARSISDEAIQPPPPHLVIPGRRESGEPGICFIPAGFRSCALRALSRMTP